MEDLLPAELMIDILSRLPVKTIIHCKCVCKKWRNLVLESSFVDLHLSRSPTGLIIHHEPFIYSNDSNDPEIPRQRYERPGILGWVEIEDKDDYHHLHHDPLMSLGLNLAPILQKSAINLMGSVNGLICLWQNHPNHDNTYICNPVTREYMMLSRQKYYRKGKETVIHGTREYIMLSRQKYYRKGKETVIHGFGMSSMTGEYKVIRIKYESSVSEAEVYTLGTGQWRSLGHVPYEFYGSNGAFLNNHCHWIVSDKEEKLCTFDLDKETFQLFPSPPPVEEAIQGSEYHYECLAIIKGCLCKMDSYDFQFTIWVMKEYGIKESWHKEVVIKQAFSPYLDWPICEPMYLIEGLKDGSIFMLHEGTLWEFYPNNKTIEDIGLFELSTFVGALPYCPSFVKLQDFELERVHMF